MDRFDQVRFDDLGIDKSNYFKLLFKKIEQEVDQLAPGRAKALIYTKLEEAYMWVGKALRDEQLDRNKEYEKYAKETAEELDKK